MIYQIQTNKSRPSKIIEKLLHFKVQVETALDDKQIAAMRNDQPISDFVYISLLSLCKNNNLNINKIFYREVKTFQRVPFL